MDIDAAQPDSPDQPRDGPAAAERALWLTMLYDELRVLAQSALDSERSDHTLSATALVHEAYLKLGGGKPGTDGESGGPAAASLRAGPATSIDRAMFFGLAAQAMRRILVDHARGKRRVKRGGGRAKLSGDALDGLADDQPSTTALDAVALDEALSKLALEHDQAARVVELRFFAGLTDAMIAEIMQINERTVRRHWTFARAWLAREIKAGDGGESDV